MENMELVETLERLKKLPDDKQWNEIKQFSVEMLELLAIKLYNEYLFKSYKGDGFLDILNVILHERVKKLNIDFEWTNENKEKFINVNDKIYQTFEKAYNEAVAAANKLEARIKNNDKFIKDYEVKIEIQPYMGDEYYDDGDDFGFGYVLSEPESDYVPIGVQIGHFCGVSLEQS
jgi:hypothetical protein